MTRGSQMALVLVAQALASPGDTVAVEALGARRAWDAFVRAGARCLPVPIDGQGLRIDALEVLLGETPIRAVFVTPQRQYPTLAVLSAERRARLLDLAAAHRFAVIEIDPGLRVPLRGPPAGAAGGRGHRAQVVVHVGTLSKISAPTSGSASWWRPGPLIFPDERAPGCVRLPRRPGARARDGRADGGRRAAAAPQPDGQGLPQPPGRALRRTGRRRSPEMLQVDPPSGGAGHLGRGRPRRSTSMPGRRAPSSGACPSTRAGASRSTAARWRVFASGSPTTPNRSCWRCRAGCDWRSRISGERAPRPAGRSESSSAGCSERAGWARCTAPGTDDSSAPWR